MTKRAKHTRRVRRPTKALQHGPRVPLSLRITSDLKQKLSEAALGNERSLSQEVERRLEQTVREYDRLGGPQLTELMETIATVMKSTGQLAGFCEARRVTNRGEWLALPFAFDQAVKAAIIVLEHHRPPGEIIVPEVTVGKDIGEDPQEASAVIQQFSEDIGELFAIRKMQTREEGK